VIFGSGARIAIQMHHRGPFRNPAGVFAIDLGLFLTEGVAFGKITGSGFDAADAAPAEAVFGGEGAHQILGVMDPAAVAKHGFSHRNLAAIGTGQSRKNDMPVLQFNDINFRKSFMARPFPSVGHLSLN